MFLGNKTNGEYFIGGPNRTHPDYMYSWDIIVCNFIFLALVLIPQEIIYWITYYREDPFVKSYKTMTVIEFEHKVKNGEQLVVLDDMVLDISKFIAHHPGGKFALQHNIGQDVSKFFYGGYNLDGNLGGAPAPGHKHSNYARKIVNKIVVAQLDRTLVQSTMCFVDP